MIPNLIRTMANSSAVLEAYLNITGALAMGSLPATLREQIALTVAEVNDNATTSRLPHDVQRTTVQQLSPLLSPTQ